ncbi:low temperature requirement protein A [Alloscardovia venturai]|uniref:Low temperature requirement protein A n=1 Tax=Alloscardovia venturai TaxID=1769421 RepID=A0ABW2Y4Q4_9BIFI
MYFNRFGRHDFKDIISMTVLQMPVLLFMAEYSTSESFEEFRIFSVGLIVLSLIQLGQYVWIAIERNGKTDTNVARIFVVMLSLRLAGIIIGTIIGGFIGVIIVSISVVAFLFYPLLANRQMKAIPLNVPHLIERLGLLTIIMLGELLVGQAQYFRLSTFTIFNIFSYLVIVNLFMFYIVEFDHVIDDHANGSKATVMVYFHYLVWFGINLVTVAYDFLDPQAPQVAHYILLGGIILFYTGVLIHSIFNRPTHRMNVRTLASIIGVIASGCIVSVMWISDIRVMATVIMLSTFIAQALFVVFNIRRIKQHSIEA